MKTEIKQKLYNHCINYIETKLNDALNAMEDAQKSANEETKSGMGDKYETTRAMIQIEKEKYEIQASEAMKLKKFIDQIDINKPFTNIQPGCLAETNEGNYFIAFNAGEVIIENIKYITISLASPLGQILSGKKQNDEILFRNKKIRITCVY